MPPRGRWHSASISLVGVGNALIDVAGFTLMARMAPDEVLARVFGVLEDLVAVSIGIGAIAASWVVDELGPRAALIGIGLVCPPPGGGLVEVGCASLDRSVGGHDLDVELLQRVPMLRTLPLPSIEHLARGLEVDGPSPAGQVVFSQGNWATATTSSSPARSRWSATGWSSRPSVRGAGFGEVALLRDSRRTAKRGGPPPTFACGHCSRTGS